MRKITLAIASTVTLTISTLSAGHTFPLQTNPDSPTSLVRPVAEGCGWGRWRGPWGGCRDTPYSGPLPGGGYALPPGAVVVPPPPVGANGCPPGYWHGPWGHCRDTPYHGPLPGGGFQ